MSYLLLAVIFLFNTSEYAASFRQEATQNQQSISTASRFVAANIKIANRSEVKVYGRVIFTMSMVNRNDSVKGRLVYTLSKDSYENLVQFLGKELSDALLKITIDNALGVPEKFTECPDLHLEFEPHAYLVEKKEITAKIQFDRLSLNIEDDKSELYKLLCIWTDRINIGRGGTQSIVNEINRLLGSPK